MSITKFNHSNPFNYTNTKEKTELIAKYQRTGWLPYQWGVWCTVYAWLRLERGLQAIPPEAFLYCDTDSIKYKGNYGYIFDEEEEELPFLLTPHDKQAK